MNQLTEQQRHMFEAAFVQFCRENCDDASDDPQELFDQFHGLRPREQERFFADFARQAKLNVRAVRRYFLGPFAQRLLYQLTAADKERVRAVCAEMRDRPFAEVFSRCMQLLHGEEGKRVHVESVKRCVHYYMRRAQ